MASCLFCRIVAGEIPAQIVHQDEWTLAFRDIAPQAPVHVLVIPKRHLAAFDQLTPADGELLAALANTANRVARDTGVAESGFRLVCNNGRDGGQSVDHLHWHVLGGRALQWPPG
ncbi:MAG: histidine triad nucleotide-binding protein [Candidatus Sericytochromatia bacterium]|nr:histidine triad nucleotide-binding protein [Candidatus Sericytochromatia bacterium]